MSLNKITVLKKHLLVSQQGNLPKILYFLPPVLWMVFMVLFGNPFQDLWYAGARQGITKGALAMTSAGVKETTKIASQLQDDLIYISEKNKKKNLFDLSNNKVLKTDSNDSFLKRKAEQQLERIAQQANKALYNEKHIAFTDSLNIIEKKDTIAKAQLVFDLDKYKHSLPSNTPSQVATPAEEIDPYPEEFTSYELSAYEQGLRDYEVNYNSYKNTPNEEATIKVEHPSEKPQAPKAKKIAFLANNYGSKNNFQRGNNKPSREERLAKSKSKVVSHTNAEAEQAAASTLPDLSKSISAVIDQKVKIRSGDKIQIRVLEDTYWKKIWIPRNTILYGLVSISSNRAKIRIPSIQLRNEKGVLDIIRTNMLAYDTDGLEGIYIDGTFNQYTKDALQEGLRTGTNLGLNSRLGRYSMNLGRRANNSPKVFIPTGYKIRLYDSSGLTNIKDFNKANPNAH